MFGFTRGGSSPGGVVTSFNGETGAVEYTPVVDAATAAALKLIPTLNVYSPGQQALVRSVRGGGPAPFYLVPAISSTPDDVFVIPTPDNPGVQWLHGSIMNPSSFLNIVSPVLDFTVPQTITFLPPLTGYSLWSSLGVAYMLTARDGTVTTGPTIKTGTNATFDNATPATVQAGLAAATVGLRSALTGNVAANNNSIAADGYAAVITVGAVLGTATVLQGRLINTIGLFS